MDAGVRIHRGVFVCLAVIVALAAGDTKSSTSAAAGRLPGMPPILNPNDIYSDDGPNNLSPVVKNFPPRVYVPNTISNTVTVIDPKTYQIIDTFRVGRLPQHVTPSYDLKTLWVLNDHGNSLTRIDPATTKIRARNDSGHRSLQHVLHAGWQVRHRGRRAAHAARFSRSATMTC